jgi:hypothetical protein
MFDKLGLAGVLGLVLLFGGIGVLAWENLLIGGGVALVVAGLGLVVYGITTTLLGSLGMGGMV